jgi:hypothetical protein
MFGVRCLYITILILRRLTGILEEGGEDAIHNCSKHITVHSTHIFELRYSRKKD